NGRRAAVRVPGHADRAAGGGGGQRAAAVRPRALYRQPPLRRQSVRGGGGRARADRGQRGRRGDAGRVNRPPGSAGGGGQLPLALRFPPDQRFETFVAAPAGALAQLRALAEGAAADWLYLSGPAATGKTHLALAACAHAQALGRRVAYLPLASAAGRLEEALAALDGYDLVALDGLEAAAGRRGDEQALFDFHNRARAAGTGVLYVARAPAAELALSLPDLRSRLAQCVRVGLQVLDDGGRREVLRV